MKICYVTNYLPGYHRTWGGGEQACYQMLRLLRKRNCKIDILSTRPDKEPEKGLGFFSVKTLENCLGRKIGEHVTKLKLMYFPFDFVSFIHSFYILKRIRPDILHLHNFNLLSFSLVPVARFLKIPTLLSIYDYWSLCPEGTLFNKKDKICHDFHGPRCIHCYKFRYLKNIQNLLLKRRRRIFDFFLKRIDAFLTLSKSSSKILQEYGIDKKRIVIIPLPLGEAIKPLSTPVEKNSILYVGWITPYKGLHIILKALPQVLKKIPRTKLYVIKTGIREDYYRRILSLTKSFRLEKHVFFLEKMSHKRLEEFLKRSNVVVIPEQWENMSPVILLESMSHARSIVASAVGGIPEFIRDGENGFLIDPKDSDGFAKKIIWIFKNEKEAYQMGKQARRDIIKICDKKKILEKTLNLYKTLVKEYG